MIKKSLAVAILIASSGTQSLATHAAQTSTFNGKTMAMSDAGVATSNYLEGLNLNPAALANIEDRDNFNFHINAGALASDEDELLDNAEKLSDLLDGIHNMVPSAQYVDDLIAQLNAISGTAATVEAGGGVYMNIPTGLVSLGLFGKSTLSAGVIADVDQNDIDLLQNAVDTATPFDTEQLNSSVTAIGALVTEVGLTFARGDGAISYGITPKHQRVEVIDYSARMDNFDEDDFDADEFTTEDSGFNVDLGVQRQVGNWRMGATLANAIGQEYESVAGREIKIEPRLTLGGGYRNAWLTAAVDVDANSTPNLITQEESQFARVGVELNAWGWAQLRMGYKSDMESVLDDTVSVGLGFSPFGVLNLDISAVSGENDTAGAALQLGFSF